MSIRSANPEDAEGIARALVEAWRAIDPPVAPQSYLDSLSVEQRAVYWRDYTANPPEHAFVLVAEDDDSGGVVGFANAGPNRRPTLPYDGELNAIYILPSHQGRGLGTALLRAAARELHARGMASMILWALKDNAPPRRFYEALGGHLLPGEPTFELGGATLSEVAYTWPDITALLPEIDPVTAP